MAIKSIASAPAISGLILFGTVTARQRRKFDRKEGGARYNICLHIMTDIGLFKPERWSDLPQPPDVPACGDAVQLPVQIVTYDKKNGTGYRLTWGNSNEAESF